MAAAAYEGLYEIFKGEMEGLGRQPWCPKRSAKGNVSAMTKACLLLAGFQSLPRSLPRSGKTLQTSRSPSPKQSSAVGDLRASGWAGASELGLLVPSPSKRDLSRFSFSAKEGDPVTARRTLPHKLLGRKDGGGTARTGHQVSSAHSSPGSECIL